MLGQVSRLALRAHIGGICRTANPLCRYLGALSLRDEEEHLSLGAFDYDEEDDASKSRDSRNHRHQHWMRDSIGAVSGRIIQQVECPLILGTPYTLEGALDKKSEQCRFITEARPPYRVTFVNGPLEKLCGYTANEVVGKFGLNFLHGPVSNQVALEKLAHDIKSGRRGCAELVHYHKDGHAFHHRLQVSPLMDKSGEVEYFVGVMIPLE